MTTIKRVLGVLTAIISITYFSMYGEHTDQSVFIFLGVITLILTFLLFRPTQKDKQKKASKQEKHHNKLQTCKMKHVNGLPIAENVNCAITASNDKFTFSSGSMHFELDKSKITDICIKTDTEIQQQYVSSIGGAVGGAVLFGPLGAMIGGRAKKKTVKNEIHHYLIITYQSPDIKYIGFEIGYSMASAKCFVNDFKAAHSSESTYQL